MTTTTTKSPNLKSSRSTTTTTTAQRQQQPIITVPMKRKSHQPTPIRRKDANDMEYKRIRDEYRLTGGAAPIVREGGGRRPSSLQQEQQPRIDRNNDHENKKRTKTRLKGLLGGEDNNSKKSSPIALMTKKKKPTTKKKGFPKKPFIPKPELPQSAFDIQFHSPSTNTNITISVGYVGNAVRKAKEYGLINRMQGFEYRDDWSIIDTEICIKQNTSDYLNIDISSYFPHAILIGVQKGGTTALYSYLDKHPDIIHSQKELYFLDEKIDDIILHRYHEFNKPIGIPRRDVRQAYMARMRRAEIAAKWKGSQRNNQRRKKPNNLKKQRPPLDPNRSIKEREWYEKHKHKFAKLKNANQKLRNEQQQRVQFERVPPTKINNNGNIDRRQQQQQQQQLSERQT